MKACFMFIEREDAKKVEEFLSKKFKVERDNYIGYNTLYVDEKNYQQAVDEGCKFINFSGVRTAWWINTNGQRMPVCVVPLLYAELPRIFKIKKGESLEKIVDMACCQYAYKYEKLLGVPVLFERNSIANVEFRLARCHEVDNNHELYVKKIREFCQSKRQMFSKIIVYDAYGKAVTTIK